MNDCVFNANVLHVHCIILRIDRLLIDWCSSIAEESREKLEDGISTVRQNLEFLGTRVQDFSDNLPTEEDQDSGAC